MIEQPADDADMQMLRAFLEKVSEAKQKRIRHAAAMKMAGPMYVPYWCEGGYYDVAARYFAADASEEFKAAFRSKFPGCDGHPLPAGGAGNFLESSEMNASWLAEQAHCTDL